VTGCPLRAGLRACAFAGVNAGFSDGFAMAFLLDIPLDHVLARRLDISGSDSFLSGIITPCILSGSGKVSA
jgi:hypothetical protein